VRHSWLPLILALSLANACRDRAETSQAARPAESSAAEDASLPAAPEAGQREGDSSPASAPEAVPPSPEVGRTACDTDAGDGCDYETQACIHRRCVSCAKGTIPLMTSCARICVTDRDCPRGLVCNSIAGTLSTCDSPAPKRKCPRGQVWLRSNGMCLKACKSDNDCPEYQCCQWDSNAPGQICTGRCP
jgi:hypothetical protein